MKPENKAKKDISPTSSEDYSQDRFDNFQLYMMQIRDNMNIVVGHIQKMFTFFQALEKRVEALETDIRELQANAGRQASQASASVPKIGE